MNSVRVAAILSLGALAIMLVFASSLISCTMAAHTDPNPKGTLEVIDDRDAFPAVDWVYWQRINPDIIGWITIPKTTVNYPIVQADKDDPTFYLHHDVYRHVNYFGVPYLDAECEGNLMADNAAIFGHHFRAGEAMFAPFANYTDNNFSEDHKEVLIQTPDSKHRLIVRAAACIQGDDQTKRIMFINQEDFQTWYQERLREACMIRDAAIPSRITTFITCSYTTWDNERTVVYAAEERECE